jgi:alkanesulfonate monooxygenase
MIMLKVLWFIPLHGDGRYLASSIGGRKTSFEYLSQVAGAVDQLGFYGALLPTGRSCEDSWVAASALMPQTKRMRFLIAIRPGLVSPAVGARMTSTFDRLSGGRILVNIVTGGDPVELAGDALHLSHDERYVLTDEYLTIWRAIMRGDEFNFEGKYLRVKESKLLFPPVQQPYPDLYFGGSSPKALQVAAKHVDVYLSWGEPPEQVAQKIEEVRRAARDDYGRSIRFGIRLHLIVRETDAEARKAADDLIRYVDQKTIHAAQSNLANHDSHGQRRMLELHGGDLNSLWVAPNLWAGVGLVRGGAGTALVGDPDTLVQRINEYRQVGIDHFIFSGYPHLEEAYHAADLLLPKLDIEPNDVPPRSELANEAGEVVGNRRFPSRQGAVG